MSTTMQFHGKASKNNKAGALRYMANITKLNLYLSEEQYRKLCLAAEVKGISPEEVANNAVYGYLAIADPFAEDREPPEGVHEILFDIPEEAAERLMNRLQLEDYDDLDEYAKSLLLGRLDKLAAKEN